MVEPGHSVEQILLEAGGDELLHLGRGETLGLGLDRDDRRRELGERGHLGITQLEGTEPHDHDSHADDEDTEFQAERDELADHDGQTPPVRTTSARRIPSSIR